MGTSKGLTSEPRSSARAQIPNRITTLHRSSVGFVEEIVCSAPSNDPYGVGYTDRFGFVVPLSGSFQCTEGSRGYYAGTNDVVFVQPRREYAVSHPVGGDRSLLICPRPSLTELFPEAGILPADSEVRGGTPGLRLAACKLIAAAYVGADPLTLDELSIDLCRAAVQSQTLDNAPTHSGRGATLAKAKEYLHAHFRDALSLGDVAAAIGVSPVYLTQLFKRSSGLPLHQYLIAVRLNEAMIALPDASDLTALALDLGFSSHSHFTSVFRSRFGTTPSRVRMRAGISRLGGLAEPIVFPHRPLCIARGGRLVDQVDPG